MKIRTLLSLCLLLLCTSKTSGQGTHCGYKENVWLNPVRTAILKSCGVLKTNADGTNTYVSNPPLLVENPVSCKLVLNPSGEIIDLAILKSSGVRSIDQAAIAIIRKGAPYKTDSANKEPLNVSFTASDVIVKPVHGN